MRTNRKASGSVWVRNTNVAGKEQFESNILAGTLFSFDKPNPGPKNLSSMFRKAAVAQQAPPQCQGNAKNILDSSSSVFQRFRILDIIMVVAFRGCFSNTKFHFLNVA
mgnify:CR=1 FL=1